MINYDLSAHRRAFCPQAPALEGAIPVASSASVPGSGGRTAGPLWPSCTPAPEATHSCSGLPGLPGNLLGAAPLCGRGACRKPCSYSAGSPRPAAA